MNRTQRERRERRQRMLAREQGRPYQAPPGAPPSAAGRPTVKRADAPRAGIRPAAEPAAPQAPARPAAPARPMTAARRRKRRRRTLALTALALAVLLALALLTGTLGRAAAWAGDAAETLYLYFNRKGGWPAQTGIQAPLRGEPLAGGFVLMDGEDVVLYSAYGGQIHTIQPGYARPALAVGGTRFVLYNRAGTELRVESRTETLYTRSFAGGILLCAMSNNGTLAVVTQSERYAAALEVLDPAMRTRLTCSLTQADGVPVALAFADDNHRLAVGTVAALDGQMSSMVYCMDTRSEELGPRYTADPGSLLLRVAWLSGSRLLAVFDTYTAVLDAGDATELARYDYGGAVLQGASVDGRQTALLLAIRGGNQLVLLDDGMKVRGEAAAGQATAVTATASAVYLLDGDEVFCYAYDGTLRWHQRPEARPLAVLNAAQPLLVCPGTVQPLTAPPA